MKRTWVCLILLLVMMVFLVSGTVSAEALGGICGEDLLWTLEDGVLTVSGTGPMANYVKDKAPWYDSRTEIVKVVIEEGVTTVGNGAFSGCENMTELVLADSVLELGHQAFVNCWSLEAVTFPEGLQRIGTLTFDLCISLKEIVIPADVIWIGDLAFINCAELEKITVMGGNMWVGNAFGNCPKLKGIWFMGDAPRFSSSFEGANVTAYYPAGNATWTPDVLVNHGGVVTWVAFCPNGHIEELDAAVEPGCTTPGLTEGKHCSACGLVIQPQQEVEAAGHSYGQWVETMAPTVHELGKAERTCTACSSKEAKELPKLPAPEPEPSETQPTEPAPTEPQPTEPAPSESQPTETDPTEPTATETQPAADQTEPQETQTLPTEPADDPVLNPEPKDDTPWVAIVIGAVAVLAGSGVAAWYLLIRKRRA